MMVTLIILMTTMAQCYYREFNFSLGREWLFCSNSSLSWSHSPAEGPTSVTGRCTVESRPSMNFDGFESSAETGRWFDRASAWIHYWTATWWRLWGLSFLSNCHFQRSLSKGKRNPAFLKQHTAGIMAQQVCSVTKTVEGWRGPLHE